MNHNTPLTYVSEVPNAPKAVGPYSPVTEFNGLVFLSGQIAIDPNRASDGKGPMIQGGIEEQAHQVMRNLEAVLIHMGLTFQRVLKTTIFLTDLSDYQIVNKIYEEHLKGARPARSTIQVSALPAGALIEIEMTAAR